MPERSDQDSSSASSSEESDSITLPNLYLWDFNHCDPKKCTGKKLAREGIVKHLKIREAFHGIVLSGESPNVLKASDREIVEKSGICAIDCSWNRLEEIPKKFRFGIMTRRLPSAVATNPTHYGWKDKLTCAEAFGLTMAVVGLSDEAQALMSSFRWGLNFLDENEEAISMYNKAKTAQEIKDMEYEIFRPKEKAESKWFGQESEDSSESQSSDEEEEDEGEEEEEDDEEEAQNKKVDSQNETQ